jgi:hypothetical protein
MTRRAKAISSMTTHYYHRTKGTYEIRKATPTGYVVVGHADTVWQARRLVKELNEKARGNG